MFIYPEFDTSVYVHQKGHWKCKHDFSPADHYGFIYVIINNITNEKYIGKKNFITKYNNWETYTSSSIYMKQSITLHGIQNFSFLIIQLCNTVDELAEAEYNILLENNVLKRKLPNGTKEFQNRCIHSSGFDGSRVKHGDPKIYKFYNCATHEIFEGTRLQFRERINCTIDKLSNLIRNTIKSIDNWIIHESGNNCAKGFDTKIHKFYNCILNETFVGTQLEFRKYTGLPREVSSNIIKNNKYSHNWCLYELKDSIQSRKLHGRDKTVYTIYHKKNNITITGNQQYLKKETQLDSPSFSRLIKHKQRTSKGWEIIHRQ